MAVDTLAKPQPIYIKVKAAGRDFFATCRGLYYNRLLMQVVGTFLKNILFFIVSISMTLR